MAKRTQTFIKELQIEKKLGVVTEVYVVNETVSIPTNADIKKIAIAETECLANKFAIQERKLDKVAKQAIAAAKDAASAKKEVERLVETMRETFRNVIEELLEPHYRLLAQHLGVAVPAKAANGKAAKTSTTKAAPKKAAIKNTKPKGGKPCRKK